MAIKNEDFLLVNRDTVPHKTKFSTFVSDTIHVGDNPPNAERTTPGSLWYCTADGRFYTYVDAGIPNWIEAAPPFGVPVTNLTYLPAADSGTIDISGDGTDATIPIVSGTFAGLMSPTQLSQLDSATGLDLQAVTDNGNTTDKRIETSGGVKVSGGQISSTSLNDVKFSATGEINGNDGIAGGFRSDLTSINDKTVNGFISRLQTNGGSGDLVGYHQYLIASDTDGYAGNMYAFAANGNTTINARNRLAAGNILAGFYTNLTRRRQTADGLSDEPLVDANGDPNVYNIYAPGGAPNFFGGDTYIGGTTTSNTRQLWESTLTEEQKEQLAAGTFAIPANVSTPGDGSFVRQWWYDQQSAEDQALIDAGELEYPSNFQAANFVDTFALGDNTNISLLSTGLGEFKGGVKVTGGSRSQVGTGLRSIGTDSVRLTANSKDVFLAKVDADDNQQIIMGDNSASFNDNYGMRLFNNSTADKAVYAGIQSRTQGKATNQLSGFIASLFGQDSADAYTTTSAYGFWINGYTPGTNQTTTSFKAFAVEGSGGSNSFDNAATNIGFYSQITTSGSGHDNYNFYAEGNAPNYFAGLTEHASGVKVTAGRVSSASVNAIKFAANDIILRNNGVAGAFVANITTQNDAGRVNAYMSRITANEGSGDLVGYHQYQMASDIDGYDGNIFAFLANGNSTSNARNRLANGKIMAAFYSHFSKTRLAADGINEEPLVDAAGNPNVYSIYSSGSAPNYFGGHVKLGANTLDPDWGDNFASGIKMHSSGIIVHTNQIDSDLANLTFKRTGSGGNNKVIKFYRANDEVGDISVTSVNNIAITGLAGGPLIVDNGADARNITETAAIANASAVVQQLNPVRINNERFGFTAADLQPVVSEAVVGTADETTPIGTLRDALGNILEENIMEPEAATMAVDAQTWTATGTRPVYQGVDQTKLIPLLTKALQEALEEIDSLKSRVTTLEG